MKQIPSYIGSARKVSNTGHIKYTLWLDGEGYLYVQFIENNNAGTLSDLLFSVKDCASIINNESSIGYPRGYDLKCGGFRESGNNDDGGFLKAVLRHLLQ